MVRLGMAPSGVRGRRLFQVLALRHSLTLEESAPQSPFLVAMNTKNNIIQNKET